MTFLESTNPVVTVSGGAPILSTGGPTPVISIEDSTTDQKGAVQLEDSHTSSSITMAATSKSVKEAYDRATTISGSLQTNINGKSDTAHIHDDRYYTEDEVDVLISTISGGTGVSDHSELTNLDYALSGHDGFQPSGDYLTDSEFSTYSGTLQSQIDDKADTAHIHDDRYYTESEVDTISGSLQTNIDDKADTVHFHDDRYYTEDEVDTISGSLQTNIDGKSDTVHFHDDRYYTETELDNGQLDDRYYTESEVDTVSGSLQTNIDGKSDISHLHDDRYYTESEVDTISGSLQANIDSKSNTIHTHDDRYYTESEVDILLTTISGKLDDHDELNNLDYASSGHTGFQPAGDYITDSELTSVSGALQTNIDGKSDTSHLHDDRYYTETEVDDIITTISGKLDDHNELNNLDYASSGHTGFQPTGDYLTDTEFSTYSGTLQSQIDNKSDTSHLHDDRYYIETEVDTISGSLQTNIDGKSDTDHLHDDRYYTESEIDDIITTVSGKFDDHDGLNNLDYASSGHTGFQPSGDYLTDTEFSTYSGTLQLQIDDKANTSHLHDDRYYTEIDLDGGQLDNRYYTESEVDTISGSLNTKIDGKANYIHSHNDLYYTESEVDTISGSLQTNIDGKSDTAHLHDDRYYTESEVDTISGSLQTNIDVVTDITSYTDSPMIVTGGTITHGSNAGTFKVGALTALIRETDSSIAALKYVEKSEEDNIAIPIVDTLYYVVVNYNSGSPTVSLITDLCAFNDKIPIGSVMKNAVDNVDYISGCYRLQDGVARLHYRAFELYRLYLTSGNTIAYSGTNNFTMAAGVVYEGINRLTQAAYDSAVTTFKYIYSDGAGGWTEADPNVIDFAHYDDGDGTLGDIGVAKYGCHWVYRHVDTDEVFVLYGTDSYNLAEAVVTEIPNGPDHLSNFGVLIGRIIAPQSGGSFTEISMVTDIKFTGMAIATHNDLGGLNDGDYKHLTATAYTDLTDGGDTTLHKHDTLYPLLDGRAGGQTLIGGTGTTDDLTLQTTSGTGTTGADMHFLVGNNGATEAMTILNNGNVGIGTTTPNGSLCVNGGVTVGSDIDAGDNNLRVEGTGYFVGALTAASYADNTPAYEGDALSDIKKIKGKDGKIDHDTLPEFAQINTGQMITTTISGLKTPIAKKDAFEDYDDVEMVRVKDDNDQPIISKTNITYEVRDGEVVFIETPVYETKEIHTIKKRLKDNIQFDSKTGEFYTQSDTITETQKDKPGRDLGAMISVLTSAIQQLAEKVEKLEAKK